MYKVEFAPDGKHWQLVKTGTASKMWDYFNFDRDIRENISVNPFAKFRLVSPDGIIIGVLPREGGKMRQNPKRQALRKICFYNIDWETDGEKVDLPKEVILTVAPGINIGEEGADILSDKYGFLIRSLNWEDITYYKRMKHNPEEHEKEKEAPLTDKWYNKGVEAGKTDGWMTVEDTLVETFEREHNDDAGDLVTGDTQGWEQTNHFTILYGSKMWEDAGDLYPDSMDDQIACYQELLSTFWDGYIAGREEIGIDIYDIAAKLVKKGKRRTK